MIKHKFKTNTIKVIGTYKHETFKIIAIAESDLLPQISLPSNAKKITVEAVPDTSGDTATAILHLSTYTKWSIYIAKTGIDSVSDYKKEVDVFRLFTGYLKSASYTIDLREPVQITVLSKYWVFDQPTFVDNEIVPARFSVKINKTKMIPNSLFGFFKSSSWPENNNLENKTDEGYIERNHNGDEPFIFHLLKAEECIVNVISDNEFLPGMPQRAADKKLIDNFHNKIILFDLKEPTTEVTFAFSNHDDIPTPARLIRLKNNSLYSGLMNQEFTSALNTNGQHVFIRRFERISGWSLSAVQDKPAPCSSLSGQSFPLLTTNSVNCPIKFPPIPDSIVITVNVGVYPMGEQVPSPPIITINILKGLSETDFFDLPEHFITINTVLNDDGNYIGTADLQVQGGYWWLITGQYINHPYNPASCWFQRHTSQYPVNLNYEINLQYPFGG
ncbi:hypothetical protein [Sulfurimonas sp. HSL3-7]|uniref:hypothetical protein n=1 Tax=Sulfonitrofixus jiaomeiensis TaxID=3131938 RepID=UPI0031F7EAC3